MVNLGSLYGEGYFTKGNGISADGATVAGQGCRAGQNPHGNTEAWIAIIPEPSTASLLGPGSVGLAVRRRRTA